MKKNPDLTKSIYASAYIVLVYNMRSRESHFFYLLLFILLPIFAQSQSITVSGVIIDSSSSLPVAFAGVSVMETKKGTLTDIDGHFTIQNVPANSRLQISYTGYVVKEISLANYKGPLRILITRKETALEEVVVRSDLNPAHRIILLMQQNKAKHDPLLIKSYSYNSYSIGALGTGDYLWNMGQQSAKSAKKSAAKPARKPVKKPVKKMSAKDSADMLSGMAATKELRENYMFVTETYTAKKYRYPRQVNETVLASKVSGMKNPIFAMTPTNADYFGFYTDYLPFFKKSFTSPVIAGSINLYKFSLREVIPHEKDSTYVISFEPRKGKNFDGLKGTLYINSDGYAIENVTAAAADVKDMIFSFRLQQKYERINGQWFPRQLNTNITYKDIIKDSVLLYWDTRTYLTNVDLNPVLTAADFSDITMNVPDGIGRKTEEEWAKMRVDSLQPKERATYHAYEIMPAKMLAPLNKYNDFIEAMLLQAIPVGKIDIPFKYLVSGLNRYEKLRIGAGLQTNTLFSNTVSVGGYTGYGFGDKAWKYGGNMALTFNRRTHTELRFSFSQDIQEPGTIPYFAENATLYSNGVLRSLYASRADSIRQYRVFFNTKPRPHLQFNAWMLTEERATAGYRYMFDIDGKNNFTRTYHNTEAGIGLRYSRRETYTQIGRAILMKTPPHTQVLFQLSRGLEGVLDGQLAYTKMALKFNQRFQTRYFGRTSFQAELGKIWGDVPYGYLFQTHGVAQPGRGLDGVFVGNSFQTVGIYEFTSSSMASLFLQQNFGSLLFKPASASFRPELILVQNIGYGRLKNPVRHSGIILQAPEKGIFETGLLVNDLYRINARFMYLGFGIGAFYRYGAYSLADKKQNWAFKFGLNPSF
jgi:hypothetical protein